MYIKKRTLVICSIVLIIATAFLTVGLVNPFGFTDYAGLLKFSAVTKVIRNMYYDENSESDYVNGAISGFAQGTGDPYTDYIYGDEAREYLDDVSGSFDGIGVYIENNTEDNTITVISPIAGFPAEEVGLVSGDKIMKISGVSYTGEQINEAVSNMKGQSGTYVEISVLKADTGEIVDLNVERRHVDVETVTSEMVEGTNIGRINISQFGEKTGYDFDVQLKELIDKGAKSLIIDLRNNPGGYINSAVEVASNFVKSGDEIVYTLDKNGNREDYNSKGSQYYLPVAVLINQGSASASEIVTGALKDYGLAHVIGEKSYGKGVVQSVLELGDGVLTVTIARYFTPNGTCIHGVGIEPDETIPMELSLYSQLSSLSLEQDVQLSAAVHYLQNK